MLARPAGAIVIAMSTNEQNEAAVRECFAQASAGNFDALPGIVTPDYVCHPDEARGPDGLAEMVAGYRAALSGLTVDIEHQFSVGDHVATRGTISGRHDGELNGVPATGRDVSFSFLTISRCRDGRIEEEWELVDVPALLTQIGVLAEPATA